MGERVPLFLHPGAQYLSWCYLYIIHMLCSANHQAKGTKKCSQTLSLQVDMTSSSRDL